MSAVVDVLVVGGGPAGRALAAACSDIGMSVTLVDPAPGRIWPQTYGAWHDELPSGAALSSRATVTERMWAVGTARHAWDRQYVVLDNAELHRRLRRPAIDEVTGKVTAVGHAATGSTVRLSDGRELEATVVVDASGSSRILSGGRPAGQAMQQTAVGVAVPAGEVGAVLPAGGGMFMDWRQAPGTHGGWPTFLYAVPLNGQRVLLEETSLARRPALPLSVLRRRLHARLNQAGITVAADAAEERVRFPLDDPIPRRSRMAPFGLLPFGAAAGLVHPASGFSVAASLRLAPLVADALAARLPEGPAAAASTAWALLWPGEALWVRRIQRRAAEALLAMPPALVPEFFEIFFAAEAHHRRTFLSPQSGLAEICHAMNSVFGSAPWRIRRHLLVGSFSPRRHALESGGADPR